MENLNPKEVWNYFEDITKIPRCSGKEEKIREYIKSVAEENGYEVDVDDVGNVLVKKSGTVEGVPPLVIQAHMDMVCEKVSSSDHDFSQDPIPVKKENGWITADGTTLGADNGIGIAISLAMMTNDELTHGPMEFLFTVSEETGLDGAKGIKPGYFDGKTLINLDSEKFGTFIIGCAGSGDTLIKLPVKLEETDSDSFYEVIIDGLNGGHSGLDIHKGRGNANKILSRILYETGDIKDDNTLKIQHIEGGNKRNTIPSYSRAVINIDGNEEEIIERMKKVFSEVKAEYSSVEDEMTLEIEKVDIDDLEVINGKYSKKIIEFILALPHGVLSMNQEVPGLVKTSTNLATVSQDDGEIEITMMTRSSSKSELLSNRDRIKVIAENFGAKVEENEAYPGWEPDTDSEILKISKEAFNKLHGDEPKVEAMHAGLETGIINQKYEEMDMISFGATLKGVHTPAEKIEIESVEKLWNLVTKISEEFSDKRE